MTNGQLPASALAPIAGGQLRKDAAAAWNSMNVEARKHGLELLPTGSMSSYRTFAQQQYLWNLYQSGRGNLAAFPGQSNHGEGIAVDVATPQMRALLDSIGHKYGWAKEWSDAPSEWWHIKWREGVWHGSDPGPEGVKAVTPHPITEDDMITAVVKKNGAIEVFVEKQSGEVFHTWQGGENSSWWGAEKGKRNAGWQSLGNPGK